MLSRVLRSLFPSLQGAQSPRSALGHHQPLKTWRLLDSGVGPVLRDPQEQASYHQSLDWVLLFFVSSAPFRTRDPGPGTRSLQLRKLARVPERGMHSMNVCPINCWKPNQLFMMLHPQDAPNMQRLGLGQDSDEKSRCSPRPAQRSSIWRIPPQGAHSSL